MKISLFTATLPSAGYRSGKEIIEFNNKINDVGYYSVLFVYHSKSIDYLLPIIRYLDKNHSFKYLLAMRTYAISPEYCAMLVDSFNRIAKDRLSLNIVAGDLHSEETSVEDVIEISHLINTTLKRTEYTAKWINKFIELVKNKPHIVMSGYSETTNETSEKFADEQLLMLSTYKKEMNGKIKTPKVMVSAPIYFIENENIDKNEMIQNLKNTNRMMYDSSIIGTEREVMDQIKKLKEIGVSNCMVSVLDLSQENKLHRVMKNLILEISHEKQ